MIQDPSFTYFHSGISSAVLNDTLFLFGRRSNKRSFTLDIKDTENKIWSAKEKDIQYNQDNSAFTRFYHVNFTSTIPKEPSFLYPYVFSLEESHRLLVFTRDFAIKNTSAVLPNTTLPISQPFDLFQLVPSSSDANATLSLILPKPNTVVPLYRQEASFTLSLPSKQYVYLLGGMNGISVQNDFWQYSILSLEWTKLPVPQTVRCGHTSSMLSDGRMVVIGGYRCLNPPIKDNEMQKNTSLSLIDMGIIDVFDTNTSTWQQQNQVKGDLPSPRIFHSAIVSNDKNDVLICGGQDQQLAPFQSYIGSHLKDKDQMSAILDTQHWTWRIPSSSPYQPYPQSHGIISVINKTKIIYGLGENYYTNFHTLHVFDKEREVWEYQPNITSLNQGLQLQLDLNGSSSVKWIIVSCVLSGVLIAYVIGVCIIGFYRFNLKLLYVCEGVKKRFWKPRIGEPKWAEATRLLLKTVFFGFFAYLMYVFIRQIIDSPAIDQVFFVSNGQATLNAPDIKFCFREWKEKDPPFVRCSTDFGVSCSDYLQPLPKQINQEGTEFTCILFQSPPHFQLGQFSSALESNGSFLKFDYYHSISLQGPQAHTLELTVSNRLARHESNPSEQVYQLNTQVMNTISYELIRHESLENTTWNCVGIAPSFITRYQIQTTAQSELYPFQYASSFLQRQPFGSLHVLPSHYQTKVVHEQKSFAIINAIGILGGLCGLLFSLQTCLFGYRPRSPWGYLHRWSFGHFRSSLMNGLQTNFYTASGKHKSTLSLPVILPPRSRSSRVGQDSLFFSTNQENPLVHTNMTDVRMSMVEEKVHILERLFQAYYIDDEVFRSLDQALRRADESSSLPLVPPSDILYSPVSERRTKRKEHGIM
ncbi:hypothetical protein BD560DRAFT_442917 [Blakeslea trispora]|nr:hypothetical protein BD560DRAFT_442917 [Blakeslea trispora]